LSDIDFQAEKSDRMEYMMTITNFLKEAMPTIQSDQLLGPFLMQLLQFSLAGFKVGKKFEGELDRTFQQLSQKLANPEPPKPTPEEQKMQGQLKLMEQEGQQRSQEHQQALQFRQQENQLKLVGKQQEAAVNQQVNQQKAQQNTAEFWRKMQQDAAKFQQQQAQQIMGGGGGQTPV
jgi:hypothetical protein